MSAARHCPRCRTRWGEAAYLSNAMHLFVELDVNADGNAASTSTATREPFVQPSSNETCPGLFEVGDSVLHRPSFPNRRPEALNLERTVQRRENHFSTCRPAWRFLPDVEGSRSSWGHLRDVDGGAPRSLKLSPNTVRRLFPHFVITQTKPLMKERMALSRFYHTTNLSMPF